MNVQTKILLLLLAIVATLVGGLVALKLSEEKRFQLIAAQRETERNRNFDEFLVERGDNLKVLVEDTSKWNDLVRAIVKEDRTWAEQNLNDGMLATYQANALWIYKPDWTLFYSRNNRYAESLRELPLPPEALKNLFATQKVCRFFVQVPQGWMEIRGGSIHPSIDRQAETKPQGYFLAGHVWIDENIRRMSLFTGYSLHIAPVAESNGRPDSKEDRGLITFARVLPGWDGKPVAKMVIQNDSPLIREMNRSSERLFLYLMIFAGSLFLVLSVSLVAWVRRPLRRLAVSLQTGDPTTLLPLRKFQDEFGQLAEMILKFRSTEEALHLTEEELRHAQKLEAVGRLAGGVAHDFNNLLTAIIGYAELLRLRASGDETAREYAELIRKTGEKAAELTRQLLAFSRRQLLAPKVLDLNVLIRDMEKLLHRVIGEHIRIRLEIGATDARVRADPTQLEQVILNLGVNARDAMPGGGTLTIATESREDIQSAASLGNALPQNGYVALIVRDTGCGMDAPTREKIFEPFFTTKAPGKGTGLGLATVYGIVKQTGGGIVVESEVGKGSEFLVYFPRTLEPLEELKEAPPLISSAPPSETILVVEDEEVVRLLVAAVLGEFGYHVLCAACPSEALGLIKEHPGTIDLLVTDVVMPEMHGPALAKLALQQRPAMGILFVSGYSENDIGDQGVLDPDLDVLQKPFTQQSLIRKVREMLDALRERRTEATGTPEPGLGQKNQ